MNCKECGAECPNIGALNKHRADECPKRKGAEFTEAEPVTAPDEGRQRMLETIHRYAKVLGVEVTLTDPNAPKEPEPEPEPPKPVDVVIPVAFMQRDILGALPKRSELAFRVMGWLDEEGNLHVSPHGVRWERR